MREEEALVLASSEESENAKAVLEEDNGTGSENEEYYSLPQSGSRSIIWSVVSLVLSIVSIALCMFYIPAMVLAVLAAVSAVVFRIHFGYFNKPAVLGLILSIFGAVFSVCSMIVSLLGLF